MTEANIFDPQQLATQIHKEKGRKREELYATIVSEATTSPSVLTYTLDALVPTSNQAPNTYETLIQRLDPLTIFKQFRTGQTPEFTDMRDIITGFESHPDHMIAALKGYFAQPYDALINALEMPGTDITNKPQKDRAILAAYNRATDVASGYALALLNHGDKKSVISLVSRMLQEMFNDYPLPETEQPVPLFSILDLIERYASNKENLPYRAGMTQLLIDSIDFQVNGPGQHEQSPLIQKQRNRLKVLEEKIQKLSKPRTKFSEAKISDYDRKIGLVNTNPQALATVIFDQQPELIAYFAETMYLKNHVHEMNKYYDYHHGVDPDHPSPHPYLYDMSRDPKTVYTKPFALMVTLPEKQNMVLRIKPEQGQEVSDESVRGVISYMLQA